MIGRNRTESHAARFRRERFRVIGDFGFETLQRFVNGERNASRPRCVQNYFRFFKFEIMQRRDITRRRWIKYRQPIRYTGQWFHAGDHAVRGRGEIPKMAVLEIRGQHWVTFGLERCQHADREGVSVCFHDKPAAATGLRNTSGQARHIVGEGRPDNLPFGPDRHQLAIVVGDRKKA
jgi:hypothetical protein